MAVEDSMSIPLQGHEADKVMSFSHEETHEQFLRREDIETASALVSVIEETNTLKQ